MNSDLENFLRRKLLATAFERIDNETIIMKDYFKGKGIESSYKSRDYRFFSTGLRKQVKSTENN